MTPVRIEAPAKLNLGLAVLGQRDDGMHEIDTIMAMIDLTDTITISPATAGIRIEGMDDVVLTENLIYRAAMAWCEAAGVSPAFSVAVEKRIPAPGGLAGGSSDAAATLRALNALLGDPLSPTTLIDIAGSLGADCPFFLGSPAARATGTGTTLSDLPPPAGFAVLVTPEVGFAGKTARLYGAMRADDYGSSADIDGLAADLLSGKPLATPDCRNSFDAPVGRLMPAVARVRATLDGAGLPMALTGAGPTLYRLEADADLAHECAKKIRSILGSGIRPHVSQFLSEGPPLEMLP